MTLGREEEMFRIGVAADHGGFELKVQLTQSLIEADYEVVDFGARELEDGDDYPDFVIPMARAVASGEVSRGLHLRKRRRCVRRSKQGVGRACGSDH